MKNIAVFTGTRAEYGILSHLIGILSRSEQVNLSLWVGGTHLVESFGYTAKFIEQDGYTINETLDFYQGSESELEVVKSLAFATELAADCFSRNDIDILVLLGDRYEVLALAQTAMLFKVPIAHIHGGEITEGAVDNSIRHAVSKMAHLHFVAAETYRQRLIQMGETAENVINCGAPGLDVIDELDYLTSEQLSLKFNFNFAKPYFLVTYHPLTLNEQSSVEALKAMLASFSDFPDYRVVITYPNADTFSGDLLRELKSFAQNAQNVLLVSSMGQLGYLSAMKIASLVIGNSSSGIIEAPSLNVPTVNIGDRQKGRLMARSVFSCGDNQKAISNAIKEALSLSIHRTNDCFKNPYGQGNASEKIADALVKYQRPKNLYKVFNDLELSK